MSDHELHVGSLPYDVTKDELDTVFSTYGKVTYIQVKDDGTAAVHYNTSEAAEDAIQVLHNLYKIRLDAPQPITVRWAKESDKAPSAGRSPSSGGGWSDSNQQGSYSARSSEGEGKGQEQGTGHKLFVGGLPDDISEGELKHVFSTYGNVNHIHIMKAGASTGLRAAFVFYDQKDSGDDAIKVLNDIYKIRRDATNPISVRWGKGKEENQMDQENKLFVGNLPYNITESELKQVFETYGKVKHLHVLAPKNQSGDAAALVFYEDHSAGEDAISALHDVYKIRVDAENPIRVKWGNTGKQSNDRGSWGGGGGYDSGGGGGGGDWGNKKSGGGGWSDGGWQDKRSDSGWKDKDSGSSWKSGGNDWGGGNSWQKDDWKDQRNDQKNGWNDGGRDGGRNNWQQDNSWSSRGGDQGSSSWQDQGGRGGSGGGGRGYQDYGNKPEVDDKSGRLYVSNLPEDIDENAMSYVFNNYGTVSKIHLMSNKVVKGCISAFVEYSAAEDAETAITSLNDKYEIREGYGPILVKHANKPKPKPY